MTTAKVVQVSDDAGANFHVLPGGTGEFTDDADQIDDTIFGQTYRSSEVGLISSAANANALYKGFAGYVAVLKESGAPTAIGGSEAMALVSGKTFQISAAIKEVWDRSVIPTFEDNAVPVAPADIETINYLLGQVTFTAGYTVTTPITMETGNYLPMTAVGRAQSFTLTQNAETIDKTDFATAQANGGFRVFDPGLRTVTLELGGFWADSSTFRALLIARTELVIEINPDGSGLSIARGYFKPQTLGQSGDVGALEEETITFNLQVPSDQDFVFAWRHDSTTTLHQSIQIILAAFTDETKPLVEYFPDGDAEEGYRFTSVVTDVSLSGGLDAMNEFAASFQSDGAPVVQNPA